MPVYPGTYILIVIELSIELLTCIHRLVTQTQSHIYAHYDIIHP